jgi:hypothetical protein
MMAAGNSPGSAVRGWQRQVRHIYLSLGPCLLVLLLLIAPATAHAHGGLADAILVALLLVGLAALLGLGMLVWQVILAVKQWRGPLSSRQRRVWLVLSALDLLLAAGLVIPVARHPAGDMLKLLPVIVVLAAFGAYGLLRGRRPLAPKRSADR